MKLTYNSIDNDDINSIIYPHLNRKHLKFHNLDNNDLKELDKFYKLVCNIIDECNSILINSDEKLINKYKGNLKYECHEHIEGLNLGYITNNYIFSISDSKSKKYLKDNIDFDIYRSDDEHAVLFPEINRKYLYKESDGLIGNILFIKNNEVLYQLNRFLGRVISYASFKERKYKNIFDLDLIFNQNYITQKSFTFAEILNDNSKIKSQLNDLFKEMNFSNLLIEKYKGELLKENSTYGYYDLFINGKLISKTIFNLIIQYEEDEWLSKIFETILDDIKSNKENTYYFTRYKNSKVYLCIILNLKDGKVEEIRNEEVIKQFTKKK